MKKVRWMIVVLTIAFVLLWCIGDNVYAEENLITNIEVDISSPTTILYGTPITLNDLWLKISYDEGEPQLVHPDSIEHIEWNTVGRQTVLYHYQDRQVEGDVTIVPRQVQGLKRGNSDLTSMTIQWDTLPEAQEYEIYMAEQIDGTFSLLGTTTESTYQISNLTSMKYVKVCAKANETEGAFSEIIPVAPKPPLVTGLQFMKGYKTRIQVKWNEVKGATGYRVYYKLSTKSTYRIAKDVTTTQHILEGLTAGYNYDIKVSAYTIDTENKGTSCGAIRTGTAPSSPAIPIHVGGDGRLKFTWKGVTGATYYDLYLSTKSSSGYKKLTTRKASQSKNYLKTGLANKKNYYIKVVSRRSVSGMTLQSASAIKKIYTKKPAATSTGAKFYKSQKALKKSKAYKTYKSFAKSLSYGNSYVVPGLKNTNIAGFEAKHMVPQGICFAGKYLIISAYDYSKVNNSVLYIMNKSTRKYISTIVLPHMGHVGGISFDGSNLWIAYGTKMQVLKYSTIKKAASTKKKYTVVSKFTTACDTSRQVSYMMYYKGMIWAGSYSQYSKQYLYGYRINKKSGKPTITKKAKILLPDRVQGVTVTSKGYLLLSRSCQTKKGKSGYIAQILTYKPNWKKYSGTISIGKVKKSVSMPPMNEGMVTSGAYTYVVFESSAFSECKSPMDRVVACKTSKFYPTKKKK